MARNWNNIWRWAHILFSIPVIVYFAAISSLGHEWSEDVDSVIADYFIWLLMWTGVAKWQLPRYKKWKRRRARKSPAND